MSELVSLRHAIALARIGNFARTARELRLSQPSLTRRIALLEKELGVRLFDRTHAGVVPTAFGRVFLERAEQVQRSEAALRREIELMAGIEAGTLMIGAAPYPTQISVGLAIGRLIARHPRLRVLCVTRDPRSIHKDVLLEHIDLGIAAPPDSGHDPLLEVIRVPSQRLYFACRPGHPLLKLARPDFDQVTKYPLVSTLLPGTYGYALDHGGEFPAAPNPNLPDFAPAIQVDSLAMGRQIAQSSDAVFPGTAAMLEDDVATGRLVRLDTDAPMMRTAYSILRLKDRTLSPAAQAFIGIFLAVEQEQQDGQKRTTA